MPENNDGRLLVRLDERTHAFGLAIEKLQRQTEEQTKTLLAALDTHADDDTKRFSDHDKRLRFLENWRTWAVGGLAMLAALLATIGMFWGTYK